MKILVTESQYRKILSEEKEQKILHIPSLKIFDEDILVAWNNLQKFLEKKGNPPYSIGGDLNLMRERTIKSLGNLQSVEGNLHLRYTPIKSLGNLTSVGGYLDLLNTSIESLGNLQSVGGYLNLYRKPIESLGNLTSVGGDLDLRKTPIKSLGNLTSVGGNLLLRYTPLSEKYTEEEIRQMVNVDGKIYM
jgi:hypothetical protein